DLAHPDRGLLRAAARRPQGLDRRPPLPALPLAHLPHRPALELHPVPHDPPHLARRPPAPVALHPPRHPPRPHPPLVVDGKNPSRLRTLERRPGPENHPIRRPHALNVAGRPIAVLPRCYYDGD